MHSSREPGFATRSPQPSSPLRSVLMVPANKVFRKSRVHLSQHHLTKVAFWLPQALHPPAALPPPPIPGEGTALSHYGVGLSPRD